MRIHFRIEVCINYLIVIFDRHHGHLHTSRRLSIQSWHTFGTIKVLQEPAGAAEWKWFRKDQESWYRFTKSGRNL